jgi:valyl-tRNA synthetase
MNMFGIELTGEVPFRQIHIHGLVRDAERQKMSKTKGNVVDPLVINDKFGTDAVRFGLLVSAAPGGDIALSEERLDAERAFANKIWNASRLLFGKSKEGTGVPASLADRWISSRLSAATEAANRAFEHHRYHEAAETLYHFWWGDFCDWYLELKKLETDWSYAYVVYEKALRLLHPLMPFITEELWQRLETGGKSIALAAYPMAESGDEQAEREMALFQGIITEIRQNRAAHKIDRSQVLNAGISAEGADHAFIESHLDSIAKLGNVTITLAQGPFAVKLNIPVDRARLEKENAELEKQIANLERQFADTESLAKKPEKVIAGMREKKAGYEAQLAKNRAAL